MTADCRWRALFPGCNTSGTPIYLTGFSKWSNSRGQWMPGLGERLESSRRPIREGRAQAWLYRPISLHGFMGGQSRWPPRLSASLFMWIHAPWQRAGVSDGGGAEAWPAPERNKTPCVPTAERDERFLLSPSHPADLTSCQQRLHKGLEAFVFCAAVL